MIDKLARIADRTTVFATVAEAKAVADTMSADDPDWTYTIVPDPKGTGKAIVKIYDEDAYFVANVSL